MVKILLNRSYIEIAYIYVYSIHQYAPYTHKYMYIYIYTFLASSEIMNTKPTHAFISYDNSKAEMPFCYHAQREPPFYDSVTSWNKRKWPGSTRQHPRFIMILP